MANQNIRMHGPGQVSNVAATKYIVGAGDIVTLQHIHVQNPSSAGVTFTMSIGVDSVGTRIYDGYTIGAGQVLDVFCKYVLGTSEIIQAFASVTNVLILTLDGQKAVAAGGAGFRSIYEIDLTTLPTQSMAAPASYSIDGKTWWAKGPTKAGATFGLVNGAGLQVSFPGTVPPAPLLNWRAGGDVAWGDRVMILPMASLPGFSPQAPIAAMWRFTGSAQESGGEPGIYAGFVEAASSIAAITAAERATCVTIGYQGNGTNMYILCSPHSNNVTSQWQMTLDLPSITPANTLDTLVLGMERFGLKRFFPLAGHYSGGSLLAPDDYNQFALDNTSLVRVGAGQSNSPSLIFVFPWNVSVPARSYALTHLKIMQPVP